MRFGAGFIGEGGFFFLVGRRKGGCLIGIFGCFDVVDWIGGFFWVHVGKLGGWGKGKHCVLK